MPSPAAHAFVPAPPAVPRDDDARPSSRGANLARAAAGAASASSVDAGATLAPRSRTLGTQSDYRESEAQTVPYEPDFVLPERPSTRQAALNAEHHVDGDAPEVLTLRHLRFGDGNPAGDAEATLVQRMRAKRAFEASLPPLSDVARLPLRQRLMEEWEEAEWAEREREIARVQEERLDVLKRAIDAREAEAEALAETRLKRMRAGMLADKHEKFASIQTKRVKHLRKLAARRDRERVPPEGGRAASAAEAHANYASTVYAPLSREGGAPRDGPPPYAPDPRRFESGFGTTLGEFAALEASIPRDAFDADAVVDAAKRRDETKKNAEQRREAVAEALLDATAKNLDAARRAAGGERGVGSCWPAPTDPRGSVAETTRGTTRGDGALESASHAKSRVERPETPELAPPMGGAESASAFAAVVTLQRLLRGVAARHEMREGASRRRELIAEILADAETNSEDSDAGKKSDGTLAAEAGAAMAALLRALSASDAATWDGTDLAMRYAEEERLAGAAAKIQARQRGRRARIEARRRRAEVERSGGLPDLDAFDEEETARVVRIQAHVRGRRSRRETSFVRNPELRPKKSPEPKPTRESTELIPASVSLADASAKDRASVETMQTSARAHVAILGAANETVALAGESCRAAIETLQTSARDRVARLGATRDGRDGIEPMSLEIEPATVAGMGDVPDASRFSDADFAAVAKMQASARRHLDETLRDPAPTEAMPTLDDADAANVKKMQASARALLERRQAERRAAKAEARARAKRRDAEDAEGLKDAEGLVVLDVPASAIDVDVGSLASETRDALETMQASARAHLSRATPIDVSSFSEEDRERVIKIQAATRGGLARRRVARRRVARRREEHAAEGTFAPVTFTDSTDGRASALAARRARRSESFRSEASLGREKDVVILAADVAVAAEAFPGTPAEQAAAAKIQAAYRGRSRRRRLALESEADVVARRLKEEEDAEAAAIRIQASYRGTVSRRSVASMRAKARLAGGAATSAEEEALDAAATKIQAIARGRAARQRVAELRDRR